MNTEEKGVKGGGAARARLVRFQVSDEEPLIVRHAEHFLTRLDRLETRDVDLALGLYRDPELLRAVLAQVSLPDSATRVALSLRDPIRGPFIVVTRSGHFVTCLGEGMRARGLPIVTRGQLDVLALKFSTLRDRMEEATRLTGRADSACTELLRRLVRRSDKISREEFLAVSAWEPLLAPVFLDFYVNMASELLTFAPRLRRLRSTKGAAAEKALHAYWDLAHAAEHFVLLATMGGERPHWTELATKAPHEVIELTWPLTYGGTTRFIVRGAWAAGRIGKLVLPAYKHALGENRDVFQRIDTVYALTAIARRSSKHRAEIGKVLRAVCGAGWTSADMQGLRPVEDLCGVALGMLDVKEPEIDAWFQKFIDEALVAGDLKDDDEEDLPEDLLRTAAWSSYDDGLTSGRGIIHSLSLIASAVRGAPEQFYFEKSVLDVMYEPWKPAHTEVLLSPQRAVDRAGNQPIRRAPRPGPNQPCSCGSGKKYKKCCGGPPS